MEIRGRYYGLLQKSQHVIADPAIFRRIVVAGQHVRSTTISRILRDGGIDVRPGSNDILSGIAKVNSYIAGTPKTPHLTLGTTPGTLLYVAEELPWFQDEIMSYYWKRDPQGKPTR